MQNCFLESMELLRLKCWYFDVVCVFVVFHYFLNSLKKNTKQKRLPSTENSSTRHNRTNTPQVASDPDQMKMSNQMVQFTKVLMVLFFLLQIKVK